MGGKLFQIWGLRDTFHFLSQAMPTSRALGRRYGPCRFETASLVGVPSDSSPTISSSLLQLLGLWLDLNICSWIERCSVDRPSCCEAFLDLHPALVSSIYLGSPPRLWLGVVKVTGVYREVEEALLVSEFVQHLVPHDALLASDWDLEGPVHFWFLPFN
jgi:hypothetical protein